MVLSVPAAVSSDGTRRQLWWDAEDLPSDPENLTTADVAAAVDLSFYLVSGADGFNLSRPQDQISDSRQGSSQNFQIPGRENPTLSIRYTFNDEEPGDNVAKLTLVRDAVGAFAEIYQVPEDYDPDTDGDYEGFTYVYVPSRLGIPEVMRQEANALDRINQPVSITGKIVGGTIVAGS